MKSDGYLKVLILEDNEDDVGLVERALRKEKISFEMHRVDSKEEFVEALRNDAYDVILSDHSLPQFNSSEALRLCKLAGINIPFILVTGTVSEEFAAIVLKQGADDYVLKTNLSRLPSAITNALKQKELEFARREAEAALRNQNEELVKINGELDSFVYSVSHNLRAPLMSVLGLVNVAKLDSKPRDPVYDEYFGMIKSSIGKLDETIKEILDYSQNSRNELKQEKINFLLLVSESIDKLKYLQGFKFLKINTVVEDPHPFYSDTHRLSVIFCNLISNAIKYRDEHKEDSTLEITVTVTQTEATLTFKDNGIGIREELVPRLFTMFFRATERSEGAGLGLYIIKEMISKLRGKVRATSTFGIGTTFEMIIPNQASVPAP